MRKGVERKSERKGGKQGHQERRIWEERKIRK